MGHLRIQVNEFNYKEQENGDRHDQADETSHHKMQAWVGHEVLPRDVSAVAWHMSHEDA